MLSPNWQLKTPLDAIIFDCDGTLSEIEGIDELAESNHVGAAVRELTEEAMGKTGINPQLYRQRLDLVLPTQHQVQDLGRRYLEHLTQDSDQVIQLLQRLNKPIYIISAGLYPAVSIFGKSLNIPAQHIFAVDIQFDAQGKFINYEETSALTHREGKQKIVSELLKKHPHIGYVGDGLNDYAVYNLVTRFVGYGGVFYRENIKALCEYYIENPSMTALLPLILTQAEHDALTDKEQALYQKGYISIRKNIC